MSTTPRRSSTLQETDGPEPATSGPDDASVGPPDGGSRLSRRTFLGVGTLVGGAVVAGCTDTSEQGEPDVHGIEAPGRTPGPPDHPPTHGVHEFFTADEARTVDAMAARFIPGDADDPGAREAGVLTYIDAKLAAFEAFAEPTYRQGPYAVGYDGVVPPPAQGVPVPNDELYRYGYQSEASPQESYRTGIERLDGYAEQRFGARFADLSEADQDAVLVVLDAVNRRSQGGRSREGGAAPGSGPASVPSSALDTAEEAFGAVSPGSFFEMVRMDTVEGMFADPMYGGNRGLVGWMMINYPGPQRSYSPSEMKHGTIRTPQSLDGMPAMNPGRPHRHGQDPMQKPRRGVRQG